MSKEMLKFVNVDRETPSKREVTTRKEDFKEIYSEFINEINSYRNLPIGRLC